MKTKALFFKVEDLQWSFIICCMVNVVFTILKESQSSVKNILIELFVNSWLGQMIIMILLFIMIAFISKIFLRNNKIDFALLLPYILIVSVAVLFVFYGLKAC